MKNKAFLNENIWEINSFSSDYWKSYSELISTEKHCEPKVEIFAVERL